ncbi:MAG: ATPase [Anaerolineae bacterium]|nr:ATPase [Anaerolineae bacterium]
MSHYLGVDVGATKTLAVVADGAGRVVGSGTAGPGNWEVVGWPGLRAALRQAVDAALASAAIGRQALAAAGLGVAGYDWPVQEAPTHEAIAGLELSVPYGLVNDALIGLLAGAADGWGVAVVAGTGTNCRGLDSQGREGRVTGGSTAFGEHGGAGEIVARALQDISRAWSRRGPATALTAALVHWAGAAHAADLFEGLMVGRYTLSAAAAPLVFQAAAAGDTVAREIVLWAGRELGSLAVGVIRQLRLEAETFDVVLAGSTYKGSPDLVTALGETVHQVAPGARLVRLHAPPVVGAVLLAYRQAGLDHPTLRPRLIESIATRTAHT